MRRSLTTLLIIFAALGSFALGLLAFASQAGTLGMAACPACGALSSLAWFCAAVSGLLVWPLYASVAMRFQERRAIVLPWIAVGIHAFALLMAPGIFLGRELPFVSIQFKNAPSGPWSELSSGASTRDTPGIFSAEAIGRAVSALGAGADLILGPSLGPAVQFRRTAELSLARKTLDLLQGDLAGEACAALGITDRRLCVAPAIDRLLRSNPLVSAWALGTLFEHLEKIALTHPEAGAGGMAEDLRAAQRRAAFVAMAHAAKALRAAPPPSHWPEAAFLAKQGARPPLLFSMEKHELQCRHYWLRSMTERLEHARILLRKETQRLPAAAGSDNDGWLEAQALVDGLNADMMTESFPGHSPGKVSRWWLKTTNPAASLPYALPNAAR